MLNLLYPRCYGNIQPNALWDSDCRFGEGLWFYETVDGWEILHLVASWLVVYPNIYRFFLHLRCYVRFCSQFKFTLHLLQNMCQVWAWRDLKLANHPNPAAILFFCYIDQLLWRQSFQNLPACKLPLQHILPEITMLKIFQKRDISTLIQAFCPLLQLRHIPLIQSLGQQFVVPRIIWCPRFSEGW